MKFPSTSSRQCSLQCSEPAAKSEWDPYLTALEGDATSIRVFGGGGAALSVKGSSYADSAKATESLACLGPGCYLPRLRAVAAVRLASRCGAWLPIQAVLRARGALLRGADD